MRTGNTVVVAVLLLAVGLASGCTPEGDSHEVPNLVGKSLAEANADAESEWFQTAVVGSCDGHNPPPGTTRLPTMRYSKRVDPDDCTIVSQTPEPGGLPGSPGHVITVTVE